MVPADLAMPFEGWIEVTSGLWKVAQPVKITIQPVKISGPTSASSLPEKASSSLSTVYPLFGETPGQRYSGIIGAKIIYGSVVSLNRQKISHKQTADAYVREGVKAFGFIPSLYDMGMLLAGELGHGVKLIDVGAGNNCFIEALAVQEKQKDVKMFEGLAGIDENELLNTAGKRLFEKVSIQEALALPSYRHQFDIVTLNAPPKRLWENIPEVIRGFLKQDSKIAAVVRLYRFNATGENYAFIEKTLADLCFSVVARFAALRDYPDTAFTKGMPFIVGLRPEKVGARAMAVTPSAGEPAPSFLTSSPLEDESNQGTPFWSHVWGYITYEASARKHRYPFAKVTAALCGGPVGGLMHKIQTNALGSHCHAEIWLVLEVF